MTTATVSHAHAPTVAVTALADGLVVRLTGAFEHGSEGALREALLRPRPPACHDVLVDAGEVAVLDDTALAVLLAASTWARQTGGRFSFTRVSVPVQQAAEGFGALPMLPPPGTRTT